MHLTRDELLRWRDAPDPADRDRVVLHLASCDECGSTYADLMRTRPAADAPESLDPAPFVAIGRAAWRQTATTTWRRAMIPAAAAAAIIIGVTILLPRQGGTFRGGEQNVRLSSPSGNVDAASLSFQWTAPAGTTAMRLLVYALDDSSRPVVSARGVTSPARLTAEQASALRPGTDYRWMIEFTTPDGRVETSPAQAFRLSR